MYKVSKKRPLNLHNSCAPERYCYRMKKVAEVLEGLREEERRLSVELSGVRRAIAALEEVLGTEKQVEGTTQEQSAPSVSASAPAPTVPPGPYATSSFYEAAAAYLSSAGEPRTAREIAEALQAGGYPTRAKNFTATVRTMLHRRFSTSEFGIYATEIGSRWLIRH